MSANSTTSGAATRRRRTRSIALGCSMLIFTGIGLLGVAVIAIDWLQSLETWSWDEATCRIESSSAVARPEYGDFIFAVEYSFRQGGSEHTGSVYRHGYSGSEEAQARVLASRYPVGTVMPCFVDGDDPRRSALFRGDLWKGLWILLPLVFVAVGGGALRFLRSSGQEHLETSDPGAGATIRTASPHDSPGDRTSGLGSFRKTAGMVGFFAVFLIAGLGFFIPFFLMPALKVVEARAWTEVPCEILESSVRTHVGDDGNTYSIDVLYRYEIGGRELLSDRYHFLSGSTGGYEGKAEVVEQIPAGTRTVCFVDPRDPHSAVLERGFSGEYAFGLIPLIFVLVGVGGMLVALATAHTAKKAAAGPSWVSPAVREEPYRERGAVTLEPRFGPVGKLGTTLFFALIWNGLVSVFVWVLIESWKEGQFDWFVAIVLTPFVLIGLLLAAAVPISFLALVNPKPRLRLSRAPLRPGESAQVDWSFRGAAGRIRQLTLELQAVRSPQAAGNGTRVHATVEPLETIEIVRRQRGMGLEYGSASLTIPEDSSTTPDGDAITWRLALHGDIAFWPDVHEQYELTVIGDRD